MATGRNPVTSSQPEEDAGRSAARFNEDLARTIPRLGFLAAACLVSGCWVSFVSGPATVAVGETVVYVLALGSSQGGDPELLAEVPAGWQLQSIVYDAVLDGKPFSGTGVEIASTLCDEVLGGVRPDFHRWHLQADQPLPVDLGDTGTVTLEFLVESQPAGAFDLYLVLGRITVPTGCSPPEAFTVNAQGPRFLNLRQALFDDQGGADGLDAPQQAAASPDDLHLYVASDGDRSLTAYSRDLATGELTFVEIEVDGVGGVDGLDEPRSVASSPDGRHVYVVGDGALVTFSRDTATGELEFVEQLVQHADNLISSPDGLHLYAGNDAGMSAFSRDAATGELTFVESVFPGGRLAFSPDGCHLYAARSDSIYIYGRDQISGELALLDEVTDGAGGVTGIAGVSEVVISPEGEHIYSVADGSQAVAVFERDPANGLLAFVEADFDLGGAGLDLGADSLSISPDGSHVVVAGRVAMVTFQRSGGSGRLTRVEVLYGGNLPVDRLEWAGILTFAGSRHLYALSRWSDAVLAFETAILFSDGFESGNTSAWSSSASGGS